MRSANVAAARRVLFVAGRLAPDAVLFASVILVCPPLLHGLVLCRPPRFFSLCGAGTILCIVRWSRLVEAVTCCVVPVIKCVCKPLRLVCVCLYSLFGPGAFVGLKVLCPTGVRLLLCLVRSRRCSSQ